jgi:hypothetical protein
MLGKRLNDCIRDRVQYFQTKCHFPADVGIDGRTDGEVQTNLVTEGMDTAYLSDNISLQRIIELTVDEDEECGPDSEFVLEFGPSAKNRSAQNLCRDGARYSGVAEMGCQGNPESE